MDRPRGSRPTSRPVNLETRFAEQTTCHGIGHIIDKDSPKIRRYIWAIFTITASTFCVIGCVELLQFLLSYPTNIDIQITQQDHLEFPSVTICNFNQFSKSKLSEEDNRHLRVLLRIYHKKEEVDKKEMEVAAEYFRNKTGGEFHIENITKSIGHRKEDMIVSCTWNGRPCGPQNFTWIFTVYGNCFTFNAGVDNRTLLQRGKGASYGLRLIMNIEQFKYSSELSYGAPDTGIRFSVHSNTELPEMESQGISVPPGMHAYASIPGVNIFHDLKKPWGECGEKKLEFYDHYTVASCNRELEIKYVLDRCNCTDPHHVGNFVPCQPKLMYECVLPLIATFRRSEVDARGNCPAACIQYDYDVDVSYALIPSRTMVGPFTKSYNISRVIQIAREEGFNITEDPLNFIRENFVFLDVYYKDLYSTETFKKRASGASAFLSDIGGQLGLFVGGSFLTMFEFGEYIYDKFFQQTKNKTRAFSRHIRYRRTVNHNRTASNSTNLSRSLNLSNNSGHSANGNHNGNSINQRFPTTVIYNEE